MRTAIAICSIAALSLGVIVSSAHAKGGGKGTGAGGGSSAGDIKKVRAECGGLARAKFCGGAEVHCAQGSPAQKQALAAIDACVLNHGGKL
jgi:hypothetical protein